MDKVKQYDSWHQHHAETEAQIEEPHHQWQVTDAKLQPELVDKKVMEVGCGRGYFYIRLSEKYPQAEVWGVDFSEVAITTAERRAEMRGSRARFRTDDSEALSFEDRSFDYVISCECLEHVLHPVKMASEIYRVLRPGGRFILTTENYFNGMLLQWMKTWLTKQPFDSGSGVQQHENYFLFWRVKRILEQGGLEDSPKESNY